MEKVSVPSRGERRLNHTYCFDDVMKDLFSSPPGE